MPNRTDYLDKDTIPQPEALEQALATLQRRTTNRCPICTLPVETCHCALDHQLAGELPRAWPENLP